MSGTSEDRLYNLLPELYRRRDLAADEALRALMAVLESQFNALETDITAGYNNWFVETCDAWVLPYLAELVGMTNLSQEKHVFSTQRRQVANTIGYRRRKGTIATLEHVLRDATNWPVCAVEYDQRLVVTQPLTSSHPEQGRTVDLRLKSDLVRLGGPFNRLAHTAQISHELPANDLLETPQPREYYAGGIGLYVWRLRSFRMTNSHPGSIAPAALLDFLNQSGSAEKITRLIEDDSSFGSSSARAYGVRPSLAKRIVEEREKLPQHRFERLDQVDSIPGVGPDTLHDMLTGWSGFYSFHPLGSDMPLFNWPQYITRIDQQAEPNHMPHPLSRAEFAVDLDEYRAKFEEWPEEIRPSSSHYYGPDCGLNIAIWPPDNSQLEPVSIPPSKVFSMDLSHWDGQLSFPTPESDPKDANRWSAAIDVQLGRFAVFPNFQTDRPISEDQIVVTYSYGFSASIGGGPYHRQISRQFLGGATMQIAVAKGISRQQQDGRDCFPTLKEALVHWKRYAPNQQGVIRILDNGTYEEELEIELSKGDRLSIIADNGVRPVIGMHGLSILITEDDYLETGRQLYLGGLLINGGLQIGTHQKNKATGGLSITLENCTLVMKDTQRLKPAAVDVNLAGEAARGLKLNIDSSIVGPLNLPPEAEMLKVSRSIVDNGSGYAITARSDDTQPGLDVYLERSTIFGSMYARRLTALNVICTGPVHLSMPKDKSQIQHSYIIDDSTAAGENLNPVISAKIPPPRFTSTHYGHPGYAQLSQACPVEIRGGAADGSEMGAFYELYQLQAEENLREVLEEYLPLGLEPSIHYVT